VGEIVNLRKVRKRAAKQRDHEHAAANRAVHGRTKAQRVLEAARSEKQSRDLEGHRIDAGDAP
jgi:hypothetical protein